MNQMQTGPQESSGHTITQQKLQECEEFLTEYQNKLGLKLTENNKINEILNLTFEQLQTLDAEICGIYSFNLLQFSTFLQKEVNRHQAKLKWASHNLDTLVGKYGQSYGTQYTKLEERRLILIADNSYGKALFDIISHASIVCEDLSFIAKKVEIMAVQLSELEKTKRYIYEKRRTAPLT